MARSSAQRSSDSSDVKATPVSGQQNDRTPDKDVLVQVRKQHKDTDGHLQAMLNRIAFLTAEESKVERDIANTRKRTEELLSRQTQKPGDQDVASTARDILQTLHSSDTQISSSKPGSKLLGRSSSSNNSTAAAVFSPHKGPDQRSVSASRQRTPPSVAARAAAAATRSSAPSCQRPPLAGPAGSNKLSTSASSASALPLQRTSSGRGSASTSANRPHGQLPARAKSDIGKGSSSSAASGGAAASSVDASGVPADQLAAGAGDQAAASDIACTASSIAAVATTPGAAQQDDGRDINSSSSKTLPQTTCGGGDEDLMRTHPGQCTADPSSSNSMQVLQAAACAAADLDLHATSRAMPPLSNLEGLQHFETAAVSRNVQTSSVAVRKAPPAGSSTSAAVLGGVGWGLAQKPAASLPAVLSKDEKRQLQSEVRKKQQLWKVRTTFGLEAAPTQDPDASVDVCGAGVWS